MKKMSFFIVAALLVAVALFLISCGKSESKYLGKWQDANDASATFTISKSESGLTLQTSGESNMIPVVATGDNLTVDGTTFTLDEQKQELSTNGLFDSKIVFKKITEGGK